MDTSMQITLDMECVCSICQDLLTEDPEAESCIAGPSEAKRQRVDSTSSNEPEQPEVPQPSTSSSVHAAGLKDITPELCTTSCGHIFHKQCLDNWITRKKECPTCRKRLCPVYHKKSVSKLTRVYLPLTPGQCRQCKERVKQVELAQAESAFEKSSADVCRKNEKKWMETCSIFEQKNEDLRNQLVLEEEKAEELEAQVYAGKVQEKLLKRQMIEETQAYEKEIHRLGKKLRLKEGNILEMEETETILKEKYKRLKEEAEELKRKLDQQKMRVSVDQSTIQDWKDMCKVAILEKEKLKSDRDYEREKRKLFQRWYEQGRSQDRNGGDPRSSRSEIYDSLFPSTNTESTGWTRTVNANQTTIMTNASLPKKSTIMQACTSQLSDSEEEDDTNSYNPNLMEDDKEDICGLSLSSSSSEDEETDEEKDSDGSSSSDSAEESD